MRGLSAILPKLDLLLALVSNQFAMPDPQLALLQLSTVSLHDILQITSLVSEYPQMVRNDMPIVAGGARDEGTAFVKALFRDMMGP